MKVSKFVKSSMNFLRMKGTSANSNGILSPIVLVIFSIAETSYRWSEMTSIKTQEQKIFNELLDIT